MVYRIKREGLYYCFIFFTTFCIAGISELFDISAIILTLLFFPFVTALVTIRFNIKMNEGNLIYNIYIFRHQLLFSRVIYPEKIAQIKFIRIGWNTKGAVLRMKKGLNIRLTTLDDEKGFDHLIHFAEKHRITIIKTKDYKILEKMNKGV